MSDQFHVYFAQLLVQEASVSIGYMGPRILLGHFEKEINILPLPGFKPLFLNNLTCFLVTIT